IRRRPRGARVGLLLQRAARPRAAHRVGRLSGTLKGQMMMLLKVWPNRVRVNGVRLRGVRLKPDTTYLPVIALVTVVVSGFSQTVRAQQPDLDPRIVKLVASTSEERLGAILKKLESFETRSTLSSTDSATRGVGAAREWIRQEMTSYSPRLQVSFD